MARVLVVSFSVVPGPDRHGVQVLHTLRALANRFVVDVLTLRVGDLAYVERFQKTRMLRVPIPDAPLAEQVEAFRRAVRRQVEGAEYDLVHVRDAWAGLPVIQRARTLGMRTVFDLGRSTLGEPRPADVKLAADLARDEELCWAGADLVLVPTELGRRHLASRGRAERVFVVPPGVDVDRFDWEPSDMTGPPRVIYAGALAPGRGVRVLLRAARDVVARTPARFVLVGPIEPGFEATLEQAIRQLELVGHVEVLAAVDNEDMPRVISRATVCVAPSADDAAERPTACFPTKILEYMACRRATVAPRVSSVTEVLTDGVDALLFERGNPSDLAGRISRLLADASQRERIAEVAHHRVRQAYPASITRRRLLEAYARLIPPSAWTPPHEAAPPILIASEKADGAASGFARPGSAVAEASFDDDDVVGPPTTITAPPPEALAAAADGPTPGPRLVPTGEDTDEVLVARTLDDALARTTDPTRRANAERTGETRTTRAEDTEPWIVIAADGSIARVSRKVPARLLASKGDESETDGTPADALPLLPAIGVAFRAGELDSSAGLPSTSQVDAELHAEIDLDDLAFVAAGKLLGPPSSADITKEDPPPKDQAK